MPQQIDGEAHEHPIFPIGEILDHDSLRDHSFDL